MSLKRIFALPLALAILGAAFPVTIAQSQDAVAERVSIMRSNGMLLRNAMRASGDDAIEAAQTFAENYGALPDLFADPGTPGGAQPAVWDNFEAFAAIFQSGEEAALAALEAAQSGDQAGYSQHIQTVAGTCATCHSQYRR